ncbi:MAG: hypothetical protein OSB82_21070, partial [Alphaproteobacteria bacterium]|nr:hypothetical protein [Alphaproteobacteria bacterium]
PTQATGSATTTAIENEVAELVAEQVHDVALHADTSAVSPAAVAQAATKPPIAAAAAEASM